MKSGTTTLFRSLDAQPGCQMPEVKEPAFFADDRRWGRGLDWYRAVFAGIGDEFLTGEASVSYTHPDRAEIAAARLFDTIPDARLVCVLREPVARLRSHYRHERQRGRERRPFAAAVTPESPYVRSSCYAAVLEPWVERARPGQLLVIRFEDLAAPDAAGWDRVLDHIGLERGERPTDRYNATADKQRFGPIARRLFDARMRRPPSWTPRVVRRTARAVLLRGSADDDPLARGAIHTPVPDAVKAILRKDTDRLPELLGPSAPCWSRG